MTIMTMDIVHYTICCYLVSLTQIEVYTLKKSLILLF